MGQDMRQENPAEVRTLPIDEVKSGKRRYVHLGEDGGFSELLGGCVDWDASSWMQAVPRVATLAKNLHV